MYFLLVLNFATVIYVLSINVKLIKKKIALVGNTTTLHVQLTFLYISLPFLHDLR